MSCAVQYVFSIHRNVAVTFSITGTKKSVKADGAMQGHAGSHEGEAGRLASQVSSLTDQLHVAQQEAHHLRHKHQVHHTCLLSGEGWICTHVVAVKLVACGLMVPISVTATLV